MNNTTTNFNQRLAEARAKALNNTTDTRLKSDVAINDSLKRESLTTMSTIIMRVVEELALDEERYAKRIASARRSAYGRICEHINILASIYAWPIDNNANASEIPELQDRMLDTLTELGIEANGDLLLDIKDAKGYNSFLDETTFETVDGIEPLFDELEYYYLTFAESAKLPIIDYKMNEASYDKLEQKALNRIVAEKQLADEALARHNAMTGDVA